MKIKIKTPSRLHFTLIDLNGSLGRIDGGIGVTLDYPNVLIEAEASNQILVEGEKKELAETIIRKAIDKVSPGDGIRIKIQSTIPEHVGLGSKTQFALAIATAINKVYSKDLSIRELANVVGRAGTSGIGVAAFESGGFILDGGHTFGPGKQKEKFLPSSASPAPPAPVIIRQDIPKDWCFVIGIPNVDKGAHGAKEVEIFKKYCPVPLKEVQKLSHLILMKTLPAIMDKDIETFGNSLYEIQKIGFKKVEVELQDQVVKKLINFMMKNGAYGSGVSSFGPTVYGLVSGIEEAEKLFLKTELFLKNHTRGLTFISGVNNSGVEIKEANFLLVGN
ncbi:MAG: beta-ribofuranosylaminobenzene 5'-phosphate synthase [Candidatus Jordarchaeum sp.]|uniref:beta-ribofuranosylaminobenzene 5'-phosphate synthase n=1 Tax=Candidatus Jordarchaeum sp. TaxID=2823881 RepID=UPI004049021E